jgi:regulator of RNase E activity RraA
MAVGRAANGEAFQDLYALLSRDLTGRVLVVSGAASVPAGVWGQILSRAAHGVGLRMAVVNGGVRDIDELQREGLTLWGRGEFTVGPAGGVRVIAVDQPVSVAGVTVRSDDLIVSDAGGLVSLPASQAHDVLAAAAEYAQAEEAVLADLERGVQLPEAYQQKSNVARRVVQQRSGRAPTPQQLQDAFDDPPGGST